MKTYPLFKVHVPKAEALAELGKVFDSGFINEGTQVTTLTGMLSEYLGANHLILTNSCTSALFLALKLAGVGPGDEVITTPMTCVATNAAIAMTGAKLVWADVDPNHGMINHHDVADKVNEKTKAVMAVAWAGTPPNLFMLDKTCKALNVKLILDAAHAFDAHYQGKPVHEWVDYTCYSFQAIKHFTTGDGGALVSRDEADYKRSKALKWFGLDRDRAKDAQGNWKGQQWDVDIQEIGYKFNMNNVSAAIGLTQMEHIDHILGKHRCNAAIYDDVFRDYLPVRPNKRPQGGESSFWVYAMKVDPELSVRKRDDLLKALNAEGIMAGVVHVPNDDYTCFADIKDTELHGLKEFAANQFSLPCGWWLDEEDIRHIARRVKELTW
jgi:dTDP-4-amino-4,6-dideoxygalactose transaminase